jgi:hypothetical protein
MKYEGVLTKMKTEIGNPIQYYLSFENDEINVNSLINNAMQITFLGQQCLNCSESKNIYRQGFCYDCFFKMPQMGKWIIRPELSTAHLGIEDRDLDYEKDVQLKPHVVYLALSSNVKVGVTRKTQVPTRWIDQGASSALEIVEAPNRYIAGITEVALKKHIPDKTNWRKMLKNEIADIDLVELRDELAEYIPEEVTPYFNESNTKVVKLDYPVLQYPEKVKSLNIGKVRSFEGILKGIKGQYLIFEDSTVFNVRSNEGNVVSLSAARE